MVAIADLTDWIDENTGEHIIWYAKRLSANDTLANGSHQAGPYIPKEFLFKVFPSLNRPEAENPDKWFEVCVDSHKDTRRVRAVWYNGRKRGAGTRDEARVTNFGGSESALLDPESTGSLAVFAFHRDVTGETSICRIWVCDFEIEADVIENIIGLVEPGKFKVWTVDPDERRAFGGPAIKERSTCWLRPDEIPDQWLKNFPSSAEIIRKTVELRGDNGSPVDIRLTRRRECEYEIFRSVEQAVELSAIFKGFQSIEEFLAHAQSMLQRRKSRSGRSLELHTRELFMEEHLVEGQDFQYQPESDVGKRPDFLFPNEAAYKDTQFPENRLRMLAVKTTCKDRWRQILSEADRVKVKHLLTLQEGLSENQFREIRNSGVQLVVPSPLMQAYSKDIRPHLQSLESFIGDLRVLNVDRT